MATALEVGKKLVELVKAGKSVEAVETLYADDIVSVEAVAMGGPQTTTGKAAVLEKNKWWMANHEIHSLEIAGPWPHGEQFITTSAVDVTPKAGPMAGRRFKMEEAALYTVEGGKIVKEAFFYSM